MHFGHEFARTLESEGFPQDWIDSAIDYKNLKKCINKIRRELLEIGLDEETIGHLSEWLEASPNGTPVAYKDREFTSVAKPDLSPIPEELSPRLRILVDRKTGQPLDAALAPETKEHLRRLAKHEMVLAGRHAELGHTHHHDTHHIIDADKWVRKDSEDDQSSIAMDELRDTKWVTIPLASAKEFFDLLEPKLQELDALNDAEEKNLEEDILDLGDAVENVIEPVREGFEARRQVNYRDLYYWREIFRLYMEKPIFYSDTERNRGALSFTEAKRRLEEYDQQLQSSGLMSRMKTPVAKAAAKQFLDVNVKILKIMHFQEMNARAMRKILKKFDKRTHLEGQAFLKDLRKRHPTLMDSGNHSTGSFANSIAKDLSAELSSKVLSIIPQVSDWTCPVCMSMAWRPVNLGCCRSVYCIRCVIKMQDEGITRCPCCNAETVMKADGRNIDFECMDFLEKYFPLETKKRQKENDKEALAREYGEEFVKPCVVM